MRKKNVDHVTPGKQSCWVHFTHTTEAHLDENVKPTQSQRTVPAASYTSSTVEKNIRTTLGKSEQHWWRETSADWWCGFITSAGSRLNKHASHRPRVLWPSTWLEWTCFFFHADFLTLILCECDIPWSPVNTGRRDKGGVKSKQKLEGRSRRKNEDGWMKLWSQEGGSHEGWRRTRLKKTWHKETSFSPPPAHLLSSSTTIQLSFP